MDSQQEREKEKKSTDEESSCEAYGPKKQRPITPPPDDGSGGSRWGDAPAEAYGPRHPPQEPEPEPEPEPHHGDNDEGGIRIDPVNLDGLFKGALGESSGIIEVVMLKCPNLGLEVLEQLLAEVSRGMYMCGVLPGLSLEENLRERRKVLDLHPVWLNTLTGHVMLELDMLLKTVMGSGAFINVRKRLELARSLVGKDHGPLCAAFPCDDILKNMSEEELQEKFGWFYTYKFGLNEPPPRDRKFELATEDDFKEELSRGSDGVLGFGCSGAVVDSQVTSVRVGTGSTEGTPGIIVDTDWKPQYHFNDGDFLKLGPENAHPPAGKTYLEHFQEQLPNKDFDTKCRQELLARKVCDEAKFKPYIIKVLQEARTLDPESHLHPELLEMLSAISFFSAFVYSIRVQKPDAIPEVLCRMLFGSLTMRVALTPHLLPQHLGHIPLGETFSFCFTGGCSPVQPTAPGTVEYTNDRIIPPQTEMGRINIKWLTYTLDLKERIHRMFRENFSSEHVLFREAMHARGLPHLAGMVPCEGHPLALQIGDCAYLHYVQGPWQNPKESTSEDCKLMLKENFPDGFYSRGQDQMAVFDIALKKLKRRDVANLLASDEDVKPFKWKNDPENPTFFPCGGTGVPRFFTGEWCCDKPHGLGTMKYGNTGRKFEGKYDSGVPHGKGTYTWGDGEQWEIEMAHGRVISSKLTGELRRWKGELNMFRGRIFLGEVDECGAAHGAGAFIYENGSVYIGTFKHGEKVKGKDFDVMPEAYADLLDNKRTNRRGIEQTNAWIKEGHKAATRIETNPLPLFEEIPESEKTPVIIVTGFLGAGKSTLINNILTRQLEWRFALIETENHEFGGVSIAKDLVKEQHIMSRDSGCPNPECPKWERSFAICLYRRGLLRFAFRSLAQTLSSLVPRRKEFEAIILETTGLADPVPIIQTFNEEHMRDNFRIDCIVSVLDSKNVTGHLLREVKAEDDVNEVVRQVAFADRIVLNKLDLVNAAELAALKEEIQSINQTAPIIEAKRWGVDLSKILNQRTFDLDNLQIKDSDCNALFTSRSHRVSSVAMNFKGNFDVPKFNMFMGKLLHTCSCGPRTLVKNGDMYRSKGILSFEGQGNTKFVFQSVHETINFRPAAKPWADEEERESKIVFIGRGLDRDELKAGLVKCLVAS